MRCFMVKWGYGEMVLFGIAFTDLTVYRGDFSGVCFLCRTKERAAAVAYFSSIR